MKKFFFLVFCLLSFELPAQNVLNPSWTSTSASGSISSAGTGTDCSIASACTWIVVPSAAKHYPGMQIVISGTFSGTLQFEGAPDGASWVSIASTTGVSSVTAGGTYTAQIPTTPFFRVRASALASGKASIALTALSYVPTITGGNGGQSGNATQVNGAAVPTGAALLGSNNAGQLVSASAINANQINGGSIPTSAAVLSSTSNGQLVAQTTVNANQVNGASVPANLSVAATNSQGQFVAGSLPVGPTWSKYLLTMSGGNFYINGVNAGAMSTTLTTQQVALFTTSARTTFSAIVIKTSTPFALVSGVLTSTVTLGTSTSGTALMMLPGDAYDPTQATSTTNFYVAGGFKIIDFGTDSIVLTINVPNNTPSQLTAGALEVDILSSVMP